MQYDYLDRIRSSVTLYTRRKTSNVLDGSFSSVFRGRSLEFEDLKEYDFGDNVHDIDWKSSSRTGKTLIRRYVSEKKHNVLLVGDTGLKMTGNTPSGESKEEIAALTMGTIAYLADRQGADFSFAWGGEKNCVFDYFRSGPEHLETLLYQYKEAVGTPGRLGFSETLYSVLDRTEKRMIIIGVTDIDGLFGIDERLLKSLTYRNDFMLVCIDDISMLQAGAYDLDIARYVPRLFRFSGKLRAVEERERAAVMEKSRKLNTRFRVPMVTVSSADRIVESVIELFERYRNGFFR